MSAEKAIEAMAKTGSITLCSLMDNSKNEA